MSELSTNDLSGASTFSDPSQYARMIPGVPALPAPRYKHKGAGNGLRIAATGNPPDARAQTSRLAEFFLPHPNNQPLALYQLVVADLFVLAVACGLQTFLLPTWGGGENCRLFAVMVTLFGFTEGVYRQQPDPFPKERLPRWEDRFCSRVCSSF